MHSLGKNQSAPDETESTVLGRGRQDGLILPQMPLGHHKDLSSFDAAIYALNQLSRQVVDANGESKTGIGTVNPNRYIAMSNEVDLGDLDLAGSIVVGKQIIWGNFSDIFQGTILKDGSEIMVAIKSLRFHGPAGQAAHDRLRKRFFREILLWRTLQHRNIVPLLGYTLPLDSPPTLVSPWYQGGNVIFYLQSCLDPDRRTLALDVVNGLEYLHSVPIVHGDLKGENVLVDANGRASLCDFGMAQFVDEATRIIGFTTSTGGAGGTDRFMCPELWNGAPKSAATDMWAVGSLIVQILTDEIPYHQLSTKQALFSAIMRGEPPSTCRNVAIDTALWASTRKCWSIKPDDRPKISEVGIHLAPQAPKDFVTPEVLQTIAFVGEQRSNYEFSGIKDDASDDDEYYDDSGEEEEILPYPSRDPASAIPQWKQQDAAVYISQTKQLRRGVTPKPPALKSNDGAIPHSPTISLVRGIASVFQEWWNPDAASQTSRTRQSRPPVHWDLPALESDDETSLDSPERKRREEWKERAKAAQTPR